MRSNLSRDTVEDFVFCIINPPVENNVHYELMVRHRNGVKYPLIQYGNCTVINTSGEMDSDHTYKVERSEHFDDVIGGVIAHAAVNREALTYSTLLPDEMPEHERWLIDVIVGMLFNDRMTYEVRELLDRVLADEPKAVVEEVLSNNSEGSFVNG